MALVLAGCSTTPVGLAPVGPNPMGLHTTAANGQLVVYSALSGHGEGNNPTWYRHTDYYICDQNGHRLEHVSNNRGYYSQTPRTVTLSAGKYIVEACAKDALRMYVPVVIKPGETTTVHLDGNWQPGTVAPQREIVIAPSGYPVGWRAEM